MRLAFISILLIIGTNSFSQNAVNDTASNTPVFVKKSKEKKEDLSNLLFKSNAGYVKLYKLNDSLFLFDAYDHNIYLNKQNIEELKKAINLIRDAEKDDQVILKSFRCDIKKGKMFGADFYSIQLYQQQTSIDISKLSEAEISALLETNDASSVVNDKGEQVIKKTSSVSYEKKVESFGITKKELNKLGEIN